MAYLPDRFQPDPVILISGRVVSSDGKPLSVDVAYESLTKQAKLGSTISDPDTGEFSLVLPFGEKYGFYAEKEGYLPVSENIDLADTSKKQYKKVDVEIVLPVIKPYGQITINNLFFDTGKSEIKSESEPELKRLAEVMKKYSSMKVQIEGHTDSVGGKEKNMALSVRRADAVGKFLLNAGVAPGNIVIKGFGETSPVAPNDTPANRQKNRRVVFKILE